MGRCYEEAKKVEQSAEFQEKLNLFKKMQKPKDKVYVSFSGGKDSTAMLIKLIENNVHFDEIVFSDTLFEYSVLYSYMDFISKVLKVDIKKLIPKSYYAKELMKKNQEIYDKLKSQRIPCVSTEVIYPEEWTPETKISLWDFWFYGIVGSGKNRGTVRSYPLVNSPCWYSREAKVKPLQNDMLDAKTIYVGIASDEKKRLNSTDPRVVFYLNEIGMTEEDCADLLKKRGLHNPLYDFSNRSGCIQCQKQGEYSLYMTWKNSFDEWLKYNVHYDNEARRLRGVGGFIDRKTNKELKLYELQRKFEEGYIPKFNLKYECNSCNAFSDYYVKEENNGISN